MTDTGRTAPRRPDTTAVYGAVLACFLVALVLFASQMRAGRDPAIGAGDQASAVPATQRPVVVKRIIETRVVRGGGPGSADAATGGAVSSSGGSAPAPAASPAPAAAPAPAPAPAPVVSRAS